jgi:KaiC/GvpD/RAD55 family RecA-like ATPase
VLELDDTRVSSGVFGLDGLLEGGLIKGRSVLLAGGPGTGKSILSWQFLFDGISKGETGVLVSLDQSRQLLIEDMSKMGWDAREAIDSNSLTLLSGDLRIIPRETGYEYMIAFDHPMLREQPFTVPRLASVVKEKAREISATRIVVDGIGALLELAGSHFEIRQLVYSFMKEIVTKDGTVLMTHELRSQPRATNDEMPYFISDGVFKLDMVKSSGDFVRTLRIVKMRGTSHVMRPVMFKISDDGITLFPETRLPD